MIRLSLIVQFDVYRIDDHCMRKPTAKELIPVKLMLIGSQIPIIPESLWASKRYFKEAGLAVEIIQPGEYT